MAITAELEITPAYCHYAAAPSRFGLRSVRSSWHERVRVDAQLGYGTGKTKLRLRLPAGPSVRAYERTRATVVPASTLSFKLRSTTASGRAG